MNSEENDRHLYNHVQFQTTRELTADKRDNIERDYEEDHPDLWKRNSGSSGWLGWAPTEEEQKNEKAVLNEGYKLFQSSLHLRRAPFGIYKSSSSSNLCWQDGHLSVIENYLRSQTAAIRNYLRPFWRSVSYCRHYRSNAALSFWRRLKIGVWNIVSAWADHRRHNANQGLVQKSGIPWLYWLFRLLGIGFENVSKVSTGENGWKGRPSRCAPGIDLLTWSVNKLVPIRIACCDDRP